jgi:hypothetical protein
MHQQHWLERGWRAGGTEIATIFYDLCTGIEAGVGGDER